MAKMSRKTALKQATTKSAAGEPLTWVYANALRRGGSALSFMRRFNLAVSRRCSGRNRRSLLRSTTCAMCVLRPAPLHSLFVNGCHSHLCVVRPGQESQNALISATGIDILSTARCRECSALGGCLARQPVSGMPWAETRRLHFGVPGYTTRGVLSSAPHTPAWGPRLSSTGCRCLPHF